METIGRRDDLTVDWQRPDPRFDNPLSDGGPATPTSSTITAARRPGGLARTLALTAVAALAILVHHRLPGGAVATSAWASWGTNITLAIVLVKVLTVGIHPARVQLARRGNELVPRHRRYGSQTSTDRDNPAGPHEHAS